MIPESSQTIIEENLYALYDKTAHINNTFSGTIDFLSWVKPQTGEWPSYFYCRDVKSIDKPNSLQNSFESFYEKYNEKSASPNNFIADPCIITKFGIENIAGMLQEFGFKPTLKWPGMFYNTQQHKKNSLNQYPEIQILNKQNIDVHAQLLTNIVDLINQVHFREALPISFFRSLLEISDIELAIQISDVGQLLCVALLNKETRSTGLYMVTVHPSFQGKGIGFGFMQRILDYICANHQNFCVLQANKRSQTFYAKAGFEKLGDFYVFSKPGLYK